MTNLIFDRTHNVSHPWAWAFAELEGNVDPNLATQRVICKNWRMDHRVSVKRENEMHKSQYFHPPLNGNNWCASRSKYFNNELCLPANKSIFGKKSAYLRDANETNAIWHKVASSNLLVHVASLNRLLKRLRKSEYDSSFDTYKFEEITGYDLPEQKPGENNDHKLNKFIDELANGLNQNGSAKIKKLAGLLCDSLGEREPPWWACFANEINKLIDDRDWPELCRALGLGHIEKGEWLIVWRYSVDTASRVYRPTVVEANDGPFHYPSPPDFSYGITMPLDRNLPACRELLHPPLKGTFASDNCTGVLGRIDNQVSDYNKIDLLRDQHKMRLLKEFTNPETKKWLDRHTR